MAEHPGSGERPVPVRDPLGDAEHLGRTFQREPREDVEFDEFRGPWVVGRQLIDHLVNTEDVRVLATGDQVFGERNPDPIAPRFVVARRRADSTRMRRMASAAAAKKCPRPSNC